MGSAAMSSELTGGVPGVQFNCGRDDAARTSVTPDNFAGGRLLAEYLLAGGRRRIGHIAGGVGCGRMGWVCASRGTYRSS